MVNNEGQEMKVKYQRHPKTPNITLCYTLELKSMNPKEERFGSFLESQQSLKIS